ncbi:MAG TPA: hypothetical protein VFR17_10910 [Mycobacterium sp.]|nr:hypothetical protein [Mycobacterium sp.]
MNRAVASVLLTAGGAALAALMSSGVAAAAPEDGGSGAANMFGLTPAGPADFTSQTGDVYQNYAYGTQTFNFDSNDMQPWIEKFLEQNVKVDGNPLTFNSSDPTIFDGLQTHVIDKNWFGGFQEQQILFQGTPDTNFTNGIIDIHHFGPIGYIYIDLVGAGNAGPTNDAIGTWMVTPMGTYDVSSWENGTFFGGLAYLESQLFDLSDFNPGADFPAADLSLIWNPFELFQ